MASGHSSPRHHACVAFRVVARERSHRRAAIGGVLVLLALGVLPVVVDHAPTGLDRAMTGIDHLGALCLAALHALLAPIHGGFHLLLAGGIVFAVWDRWRAWRKLATVLAPLDSSAPSRGDVVWNAAVAAGIRPHSVRVVAGLPNPAFTVGSMTPMIYVAAELPDRLDADQLRSVLCHEAAHVARRDPLRFSLLRALACALFWIPALSGLAEDLRDDSEIIADDVATDRGEPVVLASAILALADWRAGAKFLPQGAVGFCHGALLDRRVRRLLGEEVAVTTHVTRSSLSLAAVALSVVWVSGLLMAHPLPVPAATIPGADAHCAHHSEGPLAHLFCRKGAHTGNCPHTVGWSPEVVRHDH